MADTKFALFDFDNTLCKGDSILPFLLYCIEKKHAPFTQLFKAIGAYITHQLNPAEASNSKAATLSFLKGKSNGEIQQIARSFFRERLKKNFFPEGLKQLENLKKQGNTILVISASPELYMQVLPEFIPIDGVMATRCLMDENNCFSGIVGENCKGFQKPLRLAEYLASTHQNLDYAASSAYGDSAADAPMLQQTGNPVCVNPKKKLLQAMPNAKVVHWNVKKDD